MIYPYNTGLKSGRREHPDRDGLKEIEFFENDRGLVLYYDLCKILTPGLITLFNRAEVIVSDLAWAAGFDKFAARAGTQQIAGHNYYLSRVRNLVRRLNKPAFLTCGVHDAVLLSADLISTIELNGAEVHLAIFHAGWLYPTAQTMDELCQKLAERYLSALDFCCGYGNCLRPFQYMIGSDIDKRCLAYVAQEILQETGI